MSKLVKGSLADKIADVLSAAPANFDEEDDFTADNTEAKILENAELNEEDETEEQLLSKFRKQNLDLLADVDQKYAGKTSSRKRLRESSSEEESLDEFSENDKVSESNNESDSQNESNESEEGSSDSKYSDMQFGDDKLIVSGVEDNFKHIKEQSGSEALKKAVSVRNQMKRYEKMLEMRINLQKCLKAANCMPLKPELKVLQSETEFNKSYSQTRDKLLYTLDRLLLLQKMAFDSCADLKKAGNQNNPEEDEEIPSETEEEDLEEEKQNEPERKKRRTLVNYEKELQKRHNDYLPYRNSVIKTWNDKTRLAVAKSGSTVHSVLDQIDHTLKDKSRLIKRTQLKRSDYKIIGTVPDNTESTENEEYNTEIFDDDDFYHQQLRELIEVKSADITDPVQLGRQWIQLQSMRSKMKRNIDTRATKGRKIRYAVHSKLVNFMAPIEDNSWTDEAKNELFNSVFGKVASVGQ